MAQQDINISAKPHGNCACGEQDPAAFPELDVQTIPHEIRHATIFGALGGVRAGRGLVIRATHDPKPLLAQLAEREPGAFEVEYLERGPEIWRIQFTRVAA